MTELKSCVVLVALLLLLQSFTVFVMSVFLQLWIKKDYNNFLAGGHKILTKFNVLLGKSSLDCYKLLKGGLEAHAASYETVRK